MTYPGTEAHFEQYTKLPDLHDPIVHGPGSESIQATSQVYSSLAATIDKAVGDLKAVLARSRHSQQGQAADAARQHVLKVVSVGEAGAEHARLATYALQEQAAYFARARTDMQAAVDKAAAPAAPLPPAGKGGPEPLLSPAQQRVAQAALDAAIDGALRYEGNSNHNLNFVFQGFDAQQIAAPGASAGPQQPAPTWGGGPLGSGGHAPAPVGSASVAHTAALPALGGSGGPVIPSTAVPPTSGVPSSPVTPGLVPSTAASGGRGARPAVGASTGPGAPPPALPSTPRAAPTPPASRAVPSPSGGAPTGGPLPGRSLPGSSLPGSSLPGSSLPGSTLPDASRPGAIPIGTDPRAGRSGWVPGQPWTARPGANLPGATAGEYRPGRSSGGPGSESTRSGVGEPRPVSGRPSPPGVGEPGPSRTSTTGHQPFMPMGGAGGGGQDAEHRRPSWLVEPDPEALWMSGLPPHGPAVIEPLEE